MLNEEKFSPPSFASVAIASSTGLKKELTYHIPDSLQGRVLPGMGVIVPINNRKITGIVTFVKFSPNCPPTKKVKDILDILDEGIVFSQDLIRLWKWASSYYLASPGELLSTILPHGIRSESVRVVKVKRSERKKRQRFSQDSSSASSALLTPATAAEEMSDDERRVWTFLTEKKRVTTKTLKRRFPTLALNQLLEQFEQKGLITIQEYLPQQRLPRSSLNNSEPLSYSEAMRYISSVSLSPSQEKALEQIAPTLEAPSFNVFLVQGVTGSGKTEIYLQAAEKTLALGRSVLILVPEIALATQLVEQVRCRFGVRTAVIHSGLIPSVRWQEWRRIARGEATVAVGVRSAVFAPLKNIGLVVVDEEHDVAYKQGEGVRYNARDLAVMRGQMSGCPVILGSATPLLETYMNGKGKRYTLIHLPERIESRPLPTVEVIDLRKEDQRGEANRIFSTALQQALGENYRAGKQSLLFLNRRGYAHYLQCRLCGEAVSCGQCSVTMTFHLRGRVLRCHYCGRSQPAVDQCPACHEPTLDGSGFGTEQVEEELGRFLPQARIARLDRDSISRRGVLERVLKAWRTHEIDILIGTQMVAKGHDVPGVTLVGVLRADSSLHFPDFRSAERTFQILTQVAGRAGRGDDTGRVLLQTYLPDHYSVRCAAQQDFARFATYELRYRKRLGYPPYTRMVNIRCEGQDGVRVRTVLEHFAESFQANLQKLFPGKPSPSLLGPALAPLERVKGRERWQLLVKGEDRRTLHTLTKITYDDLRTHCRLSGVRLIVDVDPYDML